VASFEENAKNMFHAADPGLMITVNATKMPSHLVDEKTQKALFKSLDEIPNGMISMIKDMPEVVETSTNLAIVTTKDGKIFIACLLRSSVDTNKMKLADQMSGIFREAGAKTVVEGSYPGWKPNIHSPILEAMKEVYRVHFGKVPEVKVIHAGLECGILGAQYPHWDMISFGPTIRSPHSPDERVKIATVGLFWEYLVETLKHCPVR
jgi:dipeptidase D